MNAKLNQCLFCCLFSLTMGNTAIAANLTALHKSQVVENLANSLKEKYVLVDEGKAFSEEILRRNNSGDFLSSKNDSEFAQQLNRALNEIANDLHLRVMSSGPQRVSRKDMQQTDPLETQIMAGNIGLLTVNELSGSPSTIHRSMHKLASTDGLIIDVRSCPGGEFTAVSSLVSHFLPEGETIITYHTRGRKPNVSKSLPLPNRANRYKKPVYVLTSAFTGSGCEELSFDLKYHNLAYVVGKTTAGAGFGLAGEATDLGNGFSAFIPDTMPKHPKFEGGFEKVGVSPDINIDSNLALHSAHQLILSQLSQNDKNNTSITEALLSSTLKSANILIARSERNRRLRDYLGSYGDNKELILQEGELMLAGATSMPLALDEEKIDLFKIKYTPGQLLQVNRDESGRIVSISISTPHQKSWKTHKKRKNG